MYIILFLYKYVLNMYISICIPYYSIYVCVVLKELSSYTGCYTIMILTCYDRGSILLVTPASVSIPVSGYHSRGPFGSYILVHTCKVWTHSFGRKRAEVERQKSSG